MKTKNKYLSNLSTGVLVAFVAALFIFPSFKGAVMQGLMKVGLFQPSIPELSKGAEQLEPASIAKNENIFFTNEKLEKVELSSLKGKVVFINFWATWCPPCIAEMPTIQELYTEFKGQEDVVFMMVDVDNERDKSQEFMDKRKFDLPLYTPAGPIPSSYLGGAIPTTLVLNKQGEVIFKHEGLGDFSSAKFKTFIEQLIKG